MSAIGGPAGREAVWGIFQRFLHKPVEEIEDVHISNKTAKVGKGPYDLGTLFCNRLVLRRQFIAEAMKRKTSIK